MVDFRVMARVYLETRGSMTMPTTIDDVRAAKVWLDAQSSSMQEHARLLAAIESQFIAREGDFSGLPRSRPPEVEKVIQSAEDSPGAALLRETT